MSVQISAYDNEHGDPVVVMVVAGDHDVSRLVHVLHRGNCEQVDYAAEIVRKVRRHNGGRAALALLKAHGGADFTEPGSIASNLPAPGPVKVHIDPPEPDVRFVPVYVEGRGRA